MAQAEELTRGAVVEGPMLPEPCEVIATELLGASVKLIGKGLMTGSVHEPGLDGAALAQLVVTPREPPFDGKPGRFRLGREALRLGLAG